jgi:hypothetical protein
MTIHFLMQCISGSGAAFCFYTAGKLCKTKLLESAKEEALGWLIAGILLLGNIP